MYLALLTPSITLLVMVKRIFDIFFSLIGLILLCPFMLFLGVMIRFDSRGPILFRQKRVGLNGKYFSIHKFRTMQVVVDQPQLQITVAFDSRITRVGRWMRKFKLDELPQLIDVLLGHMSFVGPRPEVPQYVSLWPSDVRDLILSVRPGITDPASIEFMDENLILARSNDPHSTYVSEIMPIKLRHYSNYVDNNSLICDVRIIFSTIFALFH